jgi:hypothetical protein
MPRLHREASDGRRIDIYIVPDSEQICLPKLRIFVNL